MLSAHFVSDTILHITFTEPRLVGLTVYNGHPDITIHYVTDADLDTLINVLMREEHKRQLAKEEK